MFVAGKQSKTPWINEVNDTRSVINIHSKNIIHVAEWNFDNVKNVTAFNRWLKFWWHQHWPRVSVSIRSFLTINVSLQIDPLAMNNWLAIVSGIVGFIPLIYILARQQIRQSSLWCHHKRVTYGNIHLKKYLGHVCFQVQKVKVQYHANRLKCLCPLPGSMAIWPVCFICGANTTHDGMICLATFYVQKSKVKVTQAIHINKLAFGG